MCAFMMFGRKIKQKIHHLKLIILLIPLLKRANPYINQSRILQLTKA